MFVVHSRVDQNILDRPTDLLDTDSATGTANRLLEARLAYTRVQRSAGPLSQTSIGSARLLSFAYKVLGWRTGLHEGVLLDGGDEYPLSELKEFAGDIGASLLKVTRAIPVPAVTGQLHTEKVPHWTVVQRVARARELLPLGRTYDETLASFGRHTRRNIRNVRKVGSESGFTFTATTSPALISRRDHVALARQTRPRGVRMSLSRRLEAYAEQTGRPFRSVVRAADGSVVSYACGYMGEPASAYLLYQLNNPSFNEVSPSLLHRAHLIEWLADRAINEFVFVHGCSGILQHACLRQPLEELFLMQRTPMGYLSAGPIAFAKGDSSLGRLVRAAVLPA